MEKPDLIFVTGCNAAGKSTLIRNHMSVFPDHEIIMTDVYKGRSREVFTNAVKQEKDIILETPFNDENFKDLIDMANNAGYQSTLIVLFLRSPAQSQERVVKRRTQENGLHISPGNVEHNFIENFMNVAKYYSYFHESNFAYTGEIGDQKLIMRFEKEKLVEYKANALTYVQKFAEQAYRNLRLDKQDLEVISNNVDYKSEAQQIRVGPRFKL